MEPLLQIEHLHLTFHGLLGDVQAVRGVDLTLAPGETLALVGESGCGKTALCRAIMMLHAEHGVVEGGRILLCGQEVTAMGEKALEKVRGRDAAMIFQDPMSSLNPTLSIGRQIMEPMMLHESLSRAQARERALELLRLVEIDAPERRLDQYPHHFSGGMRQRVAIAIALACNPKLIIADEPTTALDMTTQNKIMALLQKLCADEKRGMGMLFVTHDLGLAEHIADRVAVMQGGKVVEMGKTEEIFANPQHPYTKKLLGFARYGKGGSHFHGEAGRQQGTDAQAAGRGAASVQGETASTHVCQETGSAAASMQAEPAGRTPLVSVDHLWKSFPLGRKQTRTVLRDFQMTIYEGEILALIGDSGCGKSTLARCLMGIDRPSGGEIRFHRPCRKQMIFQDSASAFNPRMTLFDIIAEPLVIKRSYGTRAMLREQVYDLMDQVGLERELAKRHPYNVSGGQRQRAAIARALITEPELLIADEPISSLDVSIQSQIVHLLKKLHDERNLTILLIAHDVPMAMHVSDRMISMEKGKCVLPHASTKAIMEGE